MPGHAHRDRLECLLLEGAECHHAIGALGLRFVDGASDRFGVATLVNWIVDGAPAYPRIDLPSKVDGSYRFAGDVRLPGMVFASIRHGPLGNPDLVRFDADAVAGMRGLVGVVKSKRYLAAVAPDALPPREGECILGVDLGGSRSMSAAALYWPATGRLEAVDGVRHVIAATLFDESALAGALQPASRDFR